jgi:hypothetical protein
VRRARAKLSIGLRAAVRGLVVVGLAAGLLLGLATVGQAAPASRPTHLVGTWDGSTLRFAVDGKVVGQRRAAGALKTSPSPVEIGSFLHGEVFYGTVDEVALYDRPMPPATILRHHRLGTTSADYARGVKQTPGLVAYWRLDDRSPARAADVLGKHLGKYGPGTALEVPGLLAHDANRAAAFDGAKGDVIVDHATDLSLPHGFTLEAWVSPGALRDQAVVSKPNSWFMKSDPRGRWGFGIFVGSTIPSAYAKQTGQVSPAPIAEAAPPPKTSAPPAKSKRRNHGDTGSNVAIIFWIVIVVCAAGGWLYYRRRRGEDEDDDEPDPDTNDAGGADGDERAQPGRDRTKVPS